MFTPQGFNFKSVSFETRSYLVKPTLAESLLVESLSDYMRKLNDEENALVVVEGVRDAKALRDSGFGGDIFMLCHNTNVTKLEDKALKFKKTILLLDNDSEGMKLTARTQKILRGRVKLDLSYQRSLLPASKGKIRHIEELSNYSERLARHI
ncbi:MAG: toprim domain-containing protein [Nitrososphaerales archaeon]